MERQLLVETQLFTPKPVQILEGHGKNNNLMVEGILATCEVKNGNGRYYKKSIWEKEIGKYMDCVKERRAMGELDHPESTVINLKNVCHNIVDIWWDGNHIMGKIELLPTPSGNILKALIDARMSVGVSSRGMGSVKQMGETLEVQDDFELLCFDFVSTPSNPGSWMHRTGSQKLNESLTKIDTLKYNRATEIIREILCAHGSCPII